MADVIFEVICVLQEQAIWLSKYGANLAATPEVTEDQAKLVYKALLKAAGLFKHVQEVWLPQLPEQGKPGSDLDHHVCSAYASQCLAEAQEGTIRSCFSRSQRRRLIFIQFLIDHN
jgi:hypothetical protein